MGTPIPDVEIYDLALTLGVNPAEIRAWDALDVKNLLLLRHAKRDARTLIAKREKVPPSVVFEPNVPLIEVDDTTNGNRKRRRTPGDPER